MLDSHNHLYKGIEYLSKDIVSFCNSALPDDWLQLQEIACTCPSIFPFYGVHPWYVSELKTSWKNDLIDCLNYSPCGIGEIGLDKIRKDFDFQKRIFIEQLDLATEFDKPVAIHCVKAWGSLIEILNEYKDDISFVVHAFSGTTEVMQELIKMGGYISFSPRNLSNERLDDCIKHVPQHRLLIETDYPCIPENLKIKYKLDTYETSLDFIYQYVANICNVELRELQMAVFKNGQIFSQQTFNR